MNMSNSFTNVPP